MRTGFPPAVSQEKQQRLLHASLTALSLSARLFVWHPWTGTSAQADFKPPQSRMRCLRRWCAEWLSQLCDEGGGVSFQTVDISSVSGFPWCLEDGESCITCDEDADEVSSSAEQRRQDQKQASRGYNADATVFSFALHSLFLSVSLCLFLVPAVLWSACQLFQCLCSLSKLFYSDSQWNFVSLSQLST